MDDRSDWAILQLILAFIKCLQIQMRAKGKKTDHLGNAEWDIHRAINQEEEFLQSQYKGFHCELCCQDKFYTVAKDFKPDDKIWIGDRPVDLRQATADVQAEAERLKEDYHG